MSIGRNDPCPCGSGQKYKKCCLIKSAPSGDELFRQRLSDSRNDLIVKILKHAAKTYGPAAIEEAWDEFHNWENDHGFDQNSVQLQVFMPWFFYDWMIDEHDEDSDVLESALVDTPPALSLLQSRGAKLDALQKEYVEECLAKGFSFYEILEVWPGKGFKAKDILTGEFHEIIEKSGSKNARPDEIIFGKAATINDLTTLEACSPIMIPPQFKVQIIDLRKHIEKQCSPITHVDLREYGIEIQYLYYQIYSSVTNPKMPVMQNTDGDLLVPHRLTYDIESPQETFDALADLCYLETTEELLRDAKMENGTLVSVDFSWSKKGNSKHASWENTVLGHIKIDGTKMVVEVNSEARANAFEDCVRERLKSGWKLKSTVIESIEQMMKRAPAKALNNEEHAKLNNNPEVQAKISQMMKAHWDGWIHSKIPALGDIAPVEAVKTKDGRESLEALLTQFERHAEQRPIPGQGVEVFKDLRKRLGL